MPKPDPNDLIKEFSEKLFGGMPDDWLDADKPPSYAMEQFNKSVAKALSEIEEGGA